MVPVAMAAAMVLRSLFKLGVALVLMIIGMGLLSGSIAALTAPGKDEKDPSKTKPRNTLVILGLFLGAFAAFVIAYAIMRYV